MRITGPEDMQIPAIDGNKIMEMLDKIDSPTEYINAITKLFPYSIGKVKAYEEIEERNYGKF